MGLFHLRMSTAIRCARTRTKPVSGTACRAFHVKIAELLRELERAFENQAQTQVDLLNGPARLRKLLACAESVRVGGIRLHLQYRLDQPGKSEVRYTMRIDFPGGSPAAIESAWTPIQIPPGTEDERLQWLKQLSAHAPAGTVDLLTDYLPAFLGVPDRPPLDLLCPYF